MAQTETIETKGHKLYATGLPIIKVPTEHILGGADPHLHGLVLQQEGEQMPYASVRPPQWRSIQGNPNVDKSDYTYLHTTRTPREELVIPTYHQLNTGGEVESLTIHNEVRYNGHQPTIPFWNAGRINDRLTAEGVNHSAEVWQYMLELNTLASPSTAARRADFLRIFSALGKIVTGLEEDGISILPVSSLPFTGRRQDVNTNPYVQRIVLGFLGWDSVRELGTSYQVHVETPDIDSAIFAVNGLRRIPHLFMATALNGPFQNNEFTGRLSAREASRRKMPTSGTLPELPDWDTLLPICIGMLKIGQVPSLPRAISNHLDFRLRPDIPPQGTIEIAFLDNPGAHIDKLLMLQEALRLTTWRLYRAYQQGEKLPPSLFGGRYDHVIEFNKSQVEKSGAEAQVLDGSTNPNSVPEQTEQLVEWIKADPAYVDNPEYPFNTLAQELRLSLTTPRFTDRDSRSMARFYETGIGTPGHYQKALFEYLTNLGLSEYAAISQSLIDYSDSYQEYLRRLDC